MSATIAPEGIDIGLLDAAIAQIEAHPEEWHQDTWRCETGMCVAGWMVTLAGDEWAYPANDESGRGAFVKVPGRYELTHAEDRALELLGVEYTSALLAIFEPYNDLRRIKALRDEIAEGIVSTEDDLYEDEDDADHYEDGDFE